MENEREKKIFRKNGSRARIDVKFGEADAEDLVARAEATAAIDIAAWIQVVRIRVRRLCPAHLRDEVEGDTLALLWLAVCSPVGVRSVPGLATAIVRTLRDRHWRRERRVELQAFGCLDMLTRAPPSASWDDAHIDANAIPLRGARQRWLIQGLLRGQTAAALAAASGLPIKEVRRQIKRLATKVLPRLDRG